LIAGGHADDITDTRADLGDEINELLGLLVREGDRGNDLRLHRFDSTLEDPASLWCDLGKGGAGIGWMRAASAQPGGLETIDIARNRRRGDPHVLRNQPQRRGTEANSAAPTQRDRA
jgi:hypothetical protein